MKKILWIFFDKQIEFNLNFIECFFLKRIFNKRKYKIKNIKHKLRGYEYETVIVDEMAELK